jgi:hypothetical protein
MKLSKAKLIKLVKPKLESLGFKEFKDTKVWQGLFIKKLDNSLYLSLGLTIHRYYENAFTGDFYLSTNTCIGAQWGDIPKEIYKRPSNFLTDVERSIYPADDINIKGTLDIWFYGDEEKSILDFITVIQIGLLQKIEQSKEVKKLTNYSEAVKKLVITNQINGTFTFLPIKEINEIPLIWFKASELILKESNDTLNTHSVIRLASDAYRQHQLTNNVPL